MKKVIIFLALALSLIAAFIQMYTPAILLFYVAFTIYAIKRIEAEKAAEKFEAEVIEVDAEEVENELINILAEDPSLQIFEIKGRVIHFALRNDDKIIAILEKGKNYNLLEFRKEEFKNMPVLHIGDEITADYYTIKNGVLRAVKIL